MLTARENSLPRHRIVITAFITVILLALAATGVEAGKLTDLCGRNNLFPVAVDALTFGSEPGSQPVPGVIYTFWNHGMPAPGSFGWLYWVDGDGQVRGTPPQNPTVNTLTMNIYDTGRSGSWRAGDWVHNASGVTGSAELLAALDARINGPLVPTVTVTIYDQVQGSGSDVTFRMDRSGAFRLVCAWLSPAYFAELHPGDCAPCAGRSSTMCLRGYFTPRREPPVVTTCDKPDL